MMTKTILLMFLVSVLLVAGQLMLVHTVPIFQNGLSALAVFKFFTSGYLWAAVCLVAISSSIWMYVLSFQAISVAYPLISFSYVLMTFAAYFLRGEPISLSKMLGIGCICLGVVFLYQNF